MQTQRNQKAGKLTDGTGQTVKGALRLTRLRQEENCDYCDSTDAVFHANVTGEPKGERNLFLCHQHRRWAIDVAKGNGWTIQDDTGVQTGAAAIKFQGVAN